MKEMQFIPGGWSAEEFLYAASFKTPYRRPFVQAEDCIMNDESEQDYISMVTKEKLGAGSVIETECSFEGSGAPLIVLCDEMKTLEDGSVQYGTHMEVVLYKNGCNIWHIVVHDGAQKATGLVKCRYPVAPGEKHRLRVEFGEKLMKIHCAGTEIDMVCPNLPETFHAGVTACEGICRFYSLKIQK